ncbi:MAG: hypothetical protein A2033_11080 [Bacteroidetes bacterium GWA2_31_9]|nr:MAG: hypothetical protein A2033_11080 [Bacteroidetes bacterium GWA2_31_9]
MIKKIFKNDYFLTFIVEFIVLISGLLVYKFAAKLPEVNDFSEYAICRRTISFIHPLLILGLGVGIPRYIAFSTENKSTNSEGSYFISGLIIVISVLIPSMIIINIFKSEFAFLFFGDKNFEYLISFLNILVVGMIFHSIAYGYLRGRLYMGYANFLQFINLGIIPLLIFFIFNNIKDVLLYTGLGWILISIIFNLLIIIKVKWNKSEIKSSAKDLLIFGIQRVPGDLVLAGFLALPAYFTAHIVSDNLTTAGYVAFSMSLLNMAGATFGPICLILLPKASRAIANKDYHLLKTYVKNITILTLVATSFGMIIIEIFANKFIDLYLGNIYDELVLCVRITIIASIGYTVYISLRSILDAYYVKAVNTKNIIISFLFFIAFSLFYYIWIDYKVILYSFVLAMLILGSLTYYETKKVLKEFSKVKL